MRKHAGLARACPTGGGRETFCNMDGWILNTLLFLQMFRREMCFLYFTRVDWYTICIMGNNFESKHIFTRFHKNSTRYL